MSDIELVIKIPEEIRLALINNIQLSPEQKSISDSCIIHAIVNATPLPKGHGRIGDLSELETRIGNFIEYYKNLLEQTNPEVLIYMNHILDGIRDTNTIIEADETESEMQNADSD